MRLLEVRNVSKDFGGVRALDGVSLAVLEGEIVSLIGPNGAGKTTLFNLLSGLQRPSAGCIKFAGMEIAGRKPHEIASLGIARTFQNIRLFKNMSVLDNVLVGQHCRFKMNPFSGFLPGTLRRKAEQAALQEARKLLEFVGLGGLGQKVAGSLPYGLERRLEIARALASGPRLLLLDEPAAGMNQAETAELIELVREIRDRGITVLLIEHDMRVVMEISEKIIVLDHGRKIAEGRPDEIRTNRAVIEAYLGQGDVAC